MNEFLLAQKMKEFGWEYIVCDFNDMNFCYNIGKFTGRIGERVNIHGAVIYKLTKPK